MALLQFISWAENDAAGLVEFAMNDGIICGPSTGPSGTATRTSKALGHTRYMPVAIILV